MLIHVIILSKFLLEWLSGDFIKYLEDWDQEIASKSHLTPSERQKLGLSGSTKEGLRLTGQLTLKLYTLKDE